MASKKKLATGADGGCGGQRSKSLKATSNEQSCVNVLLVKYYFLTKSIYEGEWSKATQTMHGYGNYTYPDGSHYKGSFSNGKFHGYGELTLPKPYEMTFKGTFVRGRLDELVEMLFSDGLKADGKLNADSGEIDFSNWEYCMDREPRLNAEHVIGMNPFGRDLQISARCPTLKLPNDCYDVNPLVTKRLPPLHPVKPINCMKERDWIKRNWCHADDTKTDYDSEIFQKIMIANLDTKDELSKMLARSDDEDTVCDYAPQTLAKKEYFKSLCCRPSEASDNTSSLETYDYQLPTSSPTSLTSIYSIHE